MSKIAFIGSGSMARAIISGLVRTGTAGEDILVVNPNNPKSCAEVRAHTRSRVPRPRRGLQRRRPWSWP